MLRTLVSFMHYVIPYSNNMPYMKLKGMLSEKHVLCELLRPDMTLHN